MRCVHFQPLGWNVAALSDVDLMYPESCGTCIEIRCNPVVITDNYGSVLDRTKACFNPSASVVVRVTDTCPCKGASKLVCPELMYLPWHAVTAEAVTDLHW